MLNMVLSNHDQDKNSKNKSDEDQPYPRVNQSKDGQQTGCELEVEVEDCSSSGGKTLDQISLKAAMYDIFLLSIPSVLGHLFDHIIDFINLLLIGHLDNPSEMAAVGLGIMVVNIVSYSTCIGLNGAIDTLVSQAYGDKEYYLCGCYLNRGLILQTLFFIPQFIIMINCDDILIALGQDTVTASFVHTYIMYLLPGIFAMVLNETFKSYLGAMADFDLSMYSQGVALMIHISLCGVLVFYLKLGFVGISIATCAAYLFNFCFIVSYIYLNDNLVPYDSWHSFNKDSFKGWGQFLKLGIPTLLMVGCECWTYEFLDIIVGLLSLNELAANVIFINVNTVVNVFAWGMSNSVSTLVGNHLGENEPNKARTYSLASAIMITTLSAIIHILMISNGEYVAMIYTDDVDVIKTVSDTIMMFAVMNFLDNIQGVLGGIIIALGYQSYGTAVTIVGHVMMMFPLCWFFGFYLDLRLLGIWMAVPVGYILATVVYVYILVTLDWKKEAESVIKRIKGETEEVSHKLHVN